MTFDIDEVPCLLFSSTDDGRITGANKTLCRHLGYSKEELSGQKLEMIFTIPTKIFQQTHLFPLLKMQGSAEEIYFTLQTKTGDQVPVLINAERKTVNGKALCLYIGIVVHNRKKFEDELVAAKKTAEAALNENSALLGAKQELQRHTEQLDQQMAVVRSQNEELRQFNRVVTHDLQEPLRKLFVFTGMLTDKEAASKFQAVDRIRKVLEQMRSTVSGLQQFLWLTESDINKTNVDLDNMLKGVLTRLQDENTGITIRLTNEKLPSIEANKDQMHYLLHEILSNSTRFRSNANEVAISISANTVMLNRFREVPGKYKYAEFLKLEIRDDGTGFDEVYKTQVFELFRGLHPQSGRGIGLALCRKIVENHHGKLTIDSKLNEGTVVTIYLPLRESVLQEEKDKTGENKNDL